ncbi:MAG: hypothetical protein JXO22_05050, partial [Phycisphaerae bacterium]|nr:hypothetical protein [Phycisphaerae bacterium]
QEGLFEGQPEDTRAVPTMLRWSAPLGTEMPSIGSDKAGGRAAITLVPSLPPTKPVLETGRSRVLPTQVVLSLEGGTSTNTPTASDIEPETTELAWVSIAGYWDYKAQQTAHEAAKYTIAQARPYIVSASVQRQELLPSGDWSDWQDVAADKAMPKLTIPEPTYDELTGRPTNSSSITDAFTLVKSHQLELVQPRFLEVVAGDDWFVPNLDGYREKDWAAREKEVEESDSPIARSGAPRSGPGMMIVGPATGGGPNFGGPSAPPGTARGRDQTGGGQRNSGGTLMGMGVGRGTTQRDRPPQVDKKAEKLRAQQDFADAKRFFAERNYDQAQQAANAVVENDEARGRLKKSAEALLKRIEYTIKLARYNSAPWQIDDRSGGPRGIFDPDDDAKVAVWFHDDTVEPGKTYRYRLRVDLWNRYVNEPKNLANPEDARRVVLAGEWSESSDPVTVIPPTRFFVTRSQDDKGTVLVDVWKWRDGWWVNEDFEVGVGDMIGTTTRIPTDDLDENGRPLDEEEVDFTTGAVVLDIRFNEPVSTRRDSGRDGYTYITRPSVVLVYLDPTDGRVCERTLSGDSVDPIYQKLKNEYQ